MVNRDKIKFIKYDKHDFQQLNFMKQNLRDFYTNDILSWEYGFDNVHSGLFFATVENEYIATQGLIPFCLIVDDKTIFSAKSESTFTLPTYRRYGLFEDLYSHVFNTAERDGIELIWGFTAISKLLKSLIGFEIFDGIIYEAELQLDLTKEISFLIKSKYSLIEKCKKANKAFYAKYKSIGSAKFIETNDYYVKILNFHNTSDQSEIIETYKNWQKQNRDLVLINPTKEFFEWRIVNNPVNEYKFLGVYKKNELIAVAIFNTTGLKAYLVDFIVTIRDDIPICFNEILRFIKKSFSITHILYWANYQNEYCKSVFNLFNSHGAFFYQNNDMNFVVKKTKTAVTGNYNTSDISKYYLNGLWTEGFKI